MAILFIIAKTSMQPRRTLVSGWINKLVHTENGILFSAKKKYTIKHEKTWKTLKCILSSEKKAI